jgi:hypothetical protein
VGHSRPRVGPAVRGGFFYFYAFGVHFGDRALSRASALAFLVCGAVAVVFLVRVLT